MNRQAGYWVMVVNLQNRSDVGSWTLTRCREKMIMNRLQATDSSVNDWMKKNQEKLVVACELNRFKGKQKEVLCVSGARLLWWTELRSDR